MSGQNSFETFRNKFAFKKRHICNTRVLRFLFSLKNIRNNKGCRGISGDIERCASHVENTVYAGNQRNSVDRKSDRRQDHGQHDHARAGNSRSSDRGESRSENNGDHLSQSQVNAVAGRDEYGANALVDGCSVHIDGGAQRQYEGSDLSCGWKKRT